MEALWQHVIAQRFLLVGTAGFEPATPDPRWPAGRAPGRETGHGARVKGPIVGLLGRVAQVWCPVLLGVLGTPPSAAQMERATPIWRSPKFLTVPALPDRETGQWNRGVCPPVRIRWPPRTAKFDVRPQAIWPRRAA